MLTRSRGIASRLAFAAAIAAGVPAVADELPRVIVESTPIAGSAVDADKVPGSVESLYAADLAAGGSASLTGAVNGHLGSVNINDDLDDPFQPNILYRGFEASPVLGTPQGLAVYQNGVRINEAFGDTVNWDLFPDIAIERVDVMSSNPLYGLNALGGGISVTMKDAFNFSGGDAEISGGSFGRREAAFEYAAKSDTLGAYVAGRALDQNGWRDFSSDSVRQLYLALSARGTGYSIDLSYARAGNQLNGQGAAPVQELAVSRSLVFTGPQSYQDTLNFGTLNATWKASEAWSLQGVLYDRQFSQGVVNGNTTSYTACTNTVNSGLLCQPDGITPLASTAGGRIPDLSDGGSVPIGEIDFESIETHGSGAALQATDTGPWFAHGNQFTAGATLDYAVVNFASSAGVGVVNPQLQIQPSGYTVDTPEGTMFVATPVVLRNVNANYGIYATDTFDASAALSLTASARYNVARIDLEDQLGPSLTGNNRYAHLNPALGAAYKLGAGWTLYGGFSENTRTPTASEIECSNPQQPCLLPSSLSGDPPTLKQVVAHTFELGARGRHSAGGQGDGILTWNLGLFHTQLNDDIYGIATSNSSGFFQNIGATRRQGLEAGVNWARGRWSAFANYSYVDASFQAALTLPSPSNPFADSNGNIHIVPGDRLPGIPLQRLKAGASCSVTSRLTLGATLNAVGSSYYFGDESNQNAPLPGFVTLGLRASLQIAQRFSLFATINNLFDAKYATYGIFGDPTGVGAPGIPAGAVGNGAGVDNRFQSPAAPIAAFIGVRGEL